MAAAFARISGPKLALCPPGPNAREVALSTPFTRLHVLIPPDITAGVPMPQIDHFTVTRQRD